MKNKRKLAVISLVVMMMVTAVGYAAWSDTVVAEGTAKSATFDVYFTAGPAGTTGLNSDCVEFTVDNILPGEQRTARLTIYNNGSVPAYLTDIGSIWMKDSFFDKLKFTINKVSAEEIASKGIGYLDITFEIADGYDFAIDGQPNVYSDTFKVWTTYSQAND